MSARPGRIVRDAGRHRAAARLFFFTAMPSSAPLRDIWTSSRCRSMRLLTACSTRTTRRRADRPHRAGRDRARAVGGGLGPLSTVLFSRPSARPPFLARSSTGFIATRVTRSRCARLRLRRDRRVAAACWRAGPNRAAVRPFCWRSTASAYRGGADADRLVRHRHRLEVFSRDLVSSSPSHTLSGVRGVDLALCIGRARAGRQRVQISPRCAGERVELDR